MIRDNNEEDLFVWGPRPVACQELYQDLKDEEADFEKTKVELQKWYNKDKGVSIQDEFLKMLAQV